MWEPQPLTILRASKACRGENFTFYLVVYALSLWKEKKCHDKARLKNSLEWIGTAPRPN
jgi:hypothetical protein